jgi:hypothetical protein
MAFPGNGTSHGTILSLVDIVPAVLNGIYQERLLHVIPNLIRHLIISSFEEPDYEIPGQAGNDVYAVYYLFKS